MRTRLCWATSAMKSTSRPRSIGHGSTIVRTPTSWSSARRSMQRRACSRRVARSSGASASQPGQPIIRCSCISVTPRASGAQPPVTVCTLCMAGAERGAAASVKMPWPPIACPCGGPSVASPRHASHAAPARRRRRSRRARRLRRARRGSLPGGRRSATCARRRHRHAGGLALRPRPRDRPPLSCRRRPARRPHPRAPATRGAGAPRPRRLRARGARAGEPRARRARGAGERHPRGVAPCGEHHDRGACARALGVPSRVPSRRRRDVADAHAACADDPPAGVRSPRPADRPPDARRLLPGRSVVAPPSRHQGRADRVPEVRRLLARRALDDRAMRRAEAARAAGRLSAARRPGGSVAPARPWRASRG